MSGTSAGSKKAVKTIRRKYGKNYWAKIGKIGGQSGHGKKGFGYDDRSLFQKLTRVPKRAKLAGIKGGTISRRRPKEEGVLF